MNYIECINVDYKSTRKESFYDLQLDVKGCRDVYASFDKYVEVERLEGDNKYHAEQYGLQDVRKGVLFIDFPPVLQLPLKRFEYDFMRDTMVKVDGYVKIFPKVAHGWMVIYDVKDKPAVKPAEEAHQNLLEWLAKNVK
ncbi:ubiquitin C-terminal hydrolase 12-like [Carya illinoinensis]|uniref:ubiquitin C-terminal hydrolase 12-like n=1 Tax=Carya illinoinensis TaxID=32201 RepID=UPI001C721C46|nr:ubiquitin C-terminal hydrolase 12-like [Carya illinoinensis]